MMLISKQILFCIFSVLSLSLWSVSCLFSLPCFPDDLNATVRVTLFTSLVDTWLSDISLRTTQLTTRLLASICGHPAALDHVMWTFALTTMVLFFLLCLFVL